MANYACRLCGIGWCPSVEWTHYWHAVYLKQTRADISGVLAIKRGDQLSEYWKYDPFPGSEVYSIRMALRRARSAFFIHQICLEKLKEYLPGQELKPNALYWAGIETPPFDFPEEDPHRTKISARRLGLPYRQVPMPAKVKRKGFNLFNQSKPSPFDLLPQEILEMIVCLLRTSDFLPLRLVCRRVAVLFHTQRFWRSRFLLHGERGHLHDFMKEQQKIVGRSRRETDWRRVYYKTKSIPRDCNNNITINSRISLWQRMEWFKDMYTMIGPPGSRGSKKGKRVPAKDKAFADSLCWTTVRGQSRCDLARSMQWAPRSIILPRTKHQHTFFDQTVIIHKPVVGLRVSVLRERDVTFITGIELVTEDMASKNTPMGYKIIDKQIIFNIKPQHLRGFRVSAGLGGIHALAIFMGPPMIYERPQVSSWIGSPTGKVSDLFSAEEIGALSGNFDHCKMISISVGKTQYDISQLPVQTDNDT